MDNMKMQESSYLIRRGKDVLDLNSDIDRINKILQYFNISDAIKIIDDVNRKHPENTSIYKIIHNIQMNNAKLIKDANWLELKEDLMWKRDYLKAKAARKTVEEIIKYGQTKNADAE